MGIFHGVGAKYPDVTNLNKDDISHLSELFAVHSSTCKLQPGSKNNGLLDSDSFTSFILDGFSNVFSLLELTPRFSKKQYRDIIRGAIASGVLVQGIDAQLLSKFSNSLMAWFDVKREGERMSTSPKHDSFDPPRQVG